MHDLSGLDADVQIERPRGWEIEIALIQREGDKASRSDMFRALLFPGLPLIALVVVVLYAIMR